MFRNVPKGLSLSAAITTYGRAFEVHVYGLSQFDAVGSDLFFSFYSIASAIHLGNKRNAYHWGQQIDTVGSEFLQHCIYHSP